MKRTFLLIFVFFFTLSIFWAEDSIKINANWVNTKKRIRINYSKLKLYEFDKITLANLEKGIIASDAEPALAELLLDIVSGDAAEYHENSIKALDILEKKFANKMHFYNVASEFAFKYPTNSPFVIAKIFNSLTNLLEKNYEGNFNTLKTVYDSIKSPYIYQSMDGTPRYGAEYIVIEIIAYIRHFLKLSKDLKIKDNPQMSKYIANMYGELGLEKSNFKNLPGAKELIQEYST